MDNVETSPFYMNKMQVDRLMKDTEVNYCIYAIYPVMYHTEIALFKE